MKTKAELLEELEDMAQDVYSGDSIIAQGGVLMGTMLYDDLKENGVDSLSAANVMLTMADIFALGASSFPNEHAIAIAATCCYVATDKFLNDVED